MAGHSALVTYATSHARARDAAQNQANPVQPRVREPHESSVKPLQTDTYCGRSNMLPDHVSAKSPATQLGPPSPYCPVESDGPIPVTT